MYSFQSLSTDRLQLRRLGDEDLMAVFELRSNAIVCQYIDRPVARLTSEASAFIERIKNGYTAGNAYYWAICLKPNQQLIGTICLWNFAPNNTVAEIGYEMLPQYFGNGYMQEALDAITDYSFTALKLNAIDAYTHQDNARSINLLKKNGFIFQEGRRDPDGEQNVVYTKTIQ